MWWFKLSLAARNRMYWISRIRRKGLIMKKKRMNTEDISRGIF